MESAMGSDSHSEATRKERLAKALRVNLKRRKAQARSKARLRDTGKEAPGPEIDKEIDEQD